MQGESAHEFELVSSTAVLPMSGAAAKVGGQDRAYRLEALTQGFEIRPAEPIRSVVRSPWGVGSSVLTDGFENGEVSFTVRINGPDNLGVAQAIADLRAMMPSGRGDTVDLVWRPHDGASPAWVRTVLAGDVRPVWDDYDHTQYRGKVQVRLTCAPHVRSEDLVTVEALPVGTGSEVTVNDCSSATGWGTAAANGAVVNSIVAAGGEVVVDVSYGYGMFASAQIQPPGSVAMTGTPYLVIETKSHYFGATDPLPQTPLLRVDGKYIEPALSTHLADGYWQMAYHVTTPTLPTINLLSMGSGRIVTRIRDIKRTATPPTTPNAGARTFDVSGTERTTGSLLIETRDGAPIGQAIIQVGPAGTMHSPSLRQFRTAGDTTTSDPGAFSGSRESIATTRFYAQVDYAAIPEGVYGLVARVRSDTPGPEQVRIDWSIGSRPLWHTLDEISTGTAVPWLSNAAGWKIVPIGEPITLPTIRADWGAVQVELQRSPGQSMGLDLDEAWLVRLDDDCGLWVIDSYQPKIRIDAATVVGQAPQVWIGDGVSWLNPGARLHAMGNLTLDPRTGGMVHHATGAPNPKVSASYHPRWTDEAAL